jgi:hypothetical protein
VDQLINLCGFYPNSIDICDRCADNANNFDSTKTHALDCPYYQSLFPEAQVGNILLPDPYFLFRSITSHMLCEDDIAEMYNAALADPILTTGKQWTLPIAHMSTFKKVAKNNRYLLAEFPNNRDGTLFSKWLMRNEAVKVIHFCFFVCPFQFFFLSLHHFFLYLGSFQYCTSRSLVLVDVVSNLFQHFHLLIVQGIATILDTDDAQNEQGLIHMVGYLNYTKWMDGNFDGSDDFEEVCYKLQSRDIGLSDYVKFVLDIPQMKHFIHLEECHENNYVMISFLMTLQCFEKYNYDNYYQWTDTELEFHSYNQNENEYNEEMHCNALQINELMHARPSTDAMVIPSTEDIVISKLIQDMYEVAQDVSLCDRPLTGLPIPPLEKENGLSIGLIQAEFNCMESNQPCKQWLGKEKALEVSCFLVDAKTVKVVPGTNANVTLLAFK